MRSQRRELPTGKAGVIDNKAVPGEVFYEVVQEMKEQ